MFPLFESIKIKDGEIFHLDLHQKRMDESFCKYFGFKNIHNLSGIFQELQISEKGLFKCRLNYGSCNFEIEIQPYQRRLIKSLRIVKCDAVNYELKYSDREIFNRLKNQNSDVDEILILRNNFLTDSSYSNIIFWNGTEWHTPSTPLLKGTQRKYLLSKNLIKEKEIGISDLKTYKTIGLINAMMDLENMPIIEVVNIQV